MASSSVTVGLRLPAIADSNQQYAGSTSVIHTDTETNPQPNALASYVQVYRAPTTPENRSVWVQTKVFRTDYSSAGAQGEWFSDYTYVNKKVL